MIELNPDQSLTIEGQPYWPLHRKAPFRQLPGALAGFPIGVPVEDAEGRLLCPFCMPARTFQVLAKHVKTHGYTGREFRMAVGWMASTPLSSQAWRDRRLATETANGNRAIRLARVSAPGFFGGHRKGDTSKRARESFAAGAFERDNKRARCREQIAAVAVPLHVKHHLDFPHLAEQGINREALLRNFGGLRAFQREFGWDGKHHYTDAEITVGLRNLAARVGHTPTVQDLKGHFPGLHVLVKWAGSLTEAMRRAGLEPNGQSPGRKPANDPETILRAFAACGSIETTARRIGSHTKTVTAALNQFGYPFPAFSKDPKRREWAAEMAKRLAGVAA